MEAACTPRLLGPLVKNLVASVGLYGCRGYLSYEHDLKGATQNPMICGWA